MYAYANYPWSCAASTPGRLGADAGDDGVTAACNVGLRRFTIGEVIAAWVALRNVTGAGASVPELVGEPAFEMAGSAPAR